MCYSWWLNLTGSDKLILEHISNLHQVVVRGVARGRSDQLGDDFCLSEHLELLPLHLDLAAPILRHLVPDSHAHCFQPLGLSFLWYGALPWFWSLQLPCNEVLLSKQDTQFRTWMRTQSNSSKMRIATPDTTDMMV